MKKTIALLAITTAMILAGYSSSIHAISPSVKKRILNAGSWRKGCPVPLSNLRYLKMSYKNFNGKDKTGEMIVHRSVAKEVTQIFEELYHSGYPIYKMRIVSDFQANDWQSIEAGNTSAFNCRPVTGGKQWSNHSYGKAIDINPIENPYIARSGRISHKASLKYRKRVRTGNSAGQKAMMLKGDKIVKLFKQKGWRWGGDWRSIKDYQHFDKPVKNRPKASTKAKPKELFNSLF